MKDVVVGAGPMGLFMAIKLKQMGVKNITVIDPRAGNYTRPGDIDPANFVKLGEEIGHLDAFSMYRGKLSSDKILEMEKKTLSNCHRNLWHCCPN